MGWDGRRCTLEERLEDLSSQFRPGIELLEEHTAEDPGRPAYVVHWQLLNVWSSDGQDLETVIICNLLEDRGGWVYVKTMSSECGPCYYSVPLSWVLDRKVTGEGYHDSWRLKVLERQAPELYRFEVLELQEAGESLEAY
jgi:hypothetical protein